MNFVIQNYLSVTFVMTKLNFVSQDLSLGNTNNFVRQKSFCPNKRHFVTTKFILSNKSNFCRVKMN